MNEDGSRRRPFLSVLSDAHREGFSGVVRVTRGEGRLAVAVRGGQVIAFESEGLAATPATEDDRELAAMLAEAFAEGEPALSLAAARQTLVETLRAPDAWGHFEAGSAESPDPPLGFGTEDLLREAAHAADAALLEDALGSLDRPLETSGDPAAIPATSLTPSEGFLLSRIDGTLTARAVLDLVPLEPAAARGSLFGLLLAGLARFGSGAPAEGRGVPSPAPRSSPTPAARTAEAREQALRERREAIKAMHARVVGQPNHFEVLGLGREATEAEVKAAYFRLAKLFHPDTLGELQDLREETEAIFSRLGAAFSILGHPQSRASYEELLPKVQEPLQAPTTWAGFNPPTPPRRPPPSVSGAPLAPVPERTAEDLARIAEENLRHAEALLGEGKFWDVIQVLDSHVGALVGRARHRGRLVLAQAYLHNPKWLHRGEDLLRGVVRDDPMNVEAYYLLGTIYKAGGLANRAASMFRKVLELRPGHKPAADELASLDMAPPPPRRWFRGREEP
jgi:tetratricopeptide (TPR) repeat protein